jgi:predicted amidophosphoribosyltransferase
VVLVGLRSLQELLFPSHCLICSLPGNEICSSCSSVWSGQPVPILFEGIRLVITTRYNACAQRIILAAKEDGMVIARKTLASAIAASLALFSEQVGNRPLTLIPVPSSNKANRLRGMAHGNELAKESSRIFFKLTGRRVSVVDLLRLARSVADQSGLNRVERSKNLHLAYFANSDGLAKLAGQDLILVDDVITSGSTAREAIRAISAAGGVLSGAIIPCAASHFFPIR